MAEARQNSALDTGLKYIGSVYAKALLGAAEKAGKADAVVAELDALIDEVLDAFPRLDATLRSPRVSFAEKSASLDRIFQQKLSPELLNFLKVLARRDRFAAIRAVRNAARQQLNELRGRIEVHLTTATPVSAESRELVLQKLKSSLRRDIDLKTHVDPDVLGGLVIRVGDTVYDGSLANQLARLRNELVETATQRMRVDADRFAVAN